jgi:hypothetical protein
MWHCASIVQHIASEDNKCFDYIAAAIELPSAVPGGTIFTQLACSKNYCIIFIYAVTWTMTSDTGQ